MAARTIAGTLLAVLLTMASPWAALAADDDPYVVEGGGWGHGVGMSQYGAYGQALAGRTYEEILKHYYHDPGKVEIATLGADLPDIEPLWVNLLQEVDGIEVANRTVGTGEGADVVITQDGVAVRLAPGEAASITMVGGLCTIAAPAETLTDGPCSIDIEWDGEAESPATRVEIPRYRGWDKQTWVDCRLTNWNSGTSPVCSYRRGMLHIRPDAAWDPVLLRWVEDKGLHLVLEVAVDDYVLGISEMPYGWGDQEGGMEALKAQAVAARTYAANRALRRPAPSERQWCWCSLYDTPVDQHYVGWGHGTSSWIEAVSDTAGEVLTHPSETDSSGENVPLQAYYFSSSGGATEDVEDVWGLAIPYLRSRDDHWAVDPAIGNPFASWTHATTAGILRHELGWDEVNDVHVVAGPPGTLVRFAGIDEGANVETERSAGWLRRRLGLRSPFISDVRRVGTQPVPFPDAEGSVHYSAIIAIHEAGITAGCGTGLYCPSAKVTRGQMASFLARALDLPDPIGDYFSDDTGSTHELNINKIREAGITTGLPDGTFRPNQLVSRAQMGSFLARAMGLEPLPGSRFADVTGSHAGNINAIAEAGVTLGCSADGTLYCPDDPVRRDQMASFLARAFLWGH